MTPEGFRRLYEATARDLLAYLLRRTPTPEDAADALAETFLVAWNRREQIPRDAADARPWLFGVARNMARRGGEHQRRASAAVADLGRELHGIQRLPPEGENPITEALAQLQPLDREIIEMLAWDGLAPREVATVLDLSPNVVRVRAHRARQRLRDSLSDRVTAR